MTEVDEIRVGDLVQYVGHTWTGRYRKKLALVYKVEGHLYFTLDPYGEQLEVYEVEIKLVQKYRP
jgi:hypothetical protein